jgi:pimeloyl-ACP methyl ester carboxylesterase
VLRLERPLLLGHSLGSQVAMMLAARSPGRFSGLALLNPVPCLAAHRFIRPYVLVWGLSKLHTWVDCTAIAPLWRQALARVWKLWGWRGGVSPKDVSIVHRRLLFVDFEGQPRRSEVLKHAGIPCLVAWAKNDGLIEAELSHALSQSLPGGARLVFESGGHHIHKHHALQLAEARAQTILTEQACAS